MMKKILFISLLSIIFGAHAVLLQDGSSVPRSKVDRIYYALKSLKHTPKWMLISDLFYSCNKNNMPKKLVCIARNIHEIINKEERFKTAVALELCDNNGIIDEETAHIILSSVRCMFKGCVPLLIDIHSPISWWAWTEVFTTKSSKK